MKQSEIVVGGVYEYVVEKDPREVIDIHRLTRYSQYVRWRHFGEKQRFVIHLALFARGAKRRIERKDI